ncbi:MAG TPA: hypothetical protein VMH32_03820 [Burkholderiales bacterium]|nr:hypothetical protein [Burkholderiales bacterium]
MAFYGLFETYRNGEEYLAAPMGLLGITTRVDVRTVIVQGPDAAVLFELETTPAADWQKPRSGEIVEVRSAVDGRPFEAVFSRDH